ncbi:hypothetical protein BG005_003011, partial [Podila minutissima]
SSMWTAPCPVSTTGQRCPRSKSQMSAGSCSRETISACSVFALREMPRSHPTSPRKN